MISEGKGHCDREKPGGFKNNPLNLNLPSFAYSSVHLRSFPFSGYRVSRHNSRNGHDLLIKYSERSDLDKPYPKGLLKEKKQKK